MLAERDVRWSQDLQDGFDIDCRLRPQSARAGLSAGAPQAAAAGWGAGGTNRACTSRSRAMV
jgi:hypothetical protein